MTDTTELVKRLEGGLAYVIPMRRMHCLFIDCISGKEVHQWQERFTGRIVMAEGSMSWFRVPVANQPALLRSMGEG